MSDAPPTIPCRTGRDERIDALEKDIALLKERATVQCLNINSAAGKIKTLEEDVDKLGKQATASVLAVNEAFAMIATIEQREAKREEAFRAQEDAYEERMRASTNQDYPEVQEIKGKVT